MCVVLDLLETAHPQPAALLIEGEPGVGKTALWFAGVERARERGIRVLAARPAAVESAAAYSSLADLLSNVDPAMLSELPEPQRVALDHVLLRATADAAPTDPRAVSAALLSVVQRLAGVSEVLVAVDDLQWIDTSSAVALAFALRRLTGPVAVLATARSDRDSVAATSWLQESCPDAIDHVWLRPMSAHELHAVLEDRLGRAFPTPSLTRIHEVSGGNPLYALELARWWDGTARTATTLPGSLAELVRARVGRLAGDVRWALLAVACCANPKLQTVAGTLGCSVVELTALLGDAETAGIVEIVGGTACFGHPLLAYGVYTDAPPALRRTMHGKLAELVDEPESRARHLALAATTATPDTLDALDAAAALARRRGAPAAAAELLELALTLGGDEVERQLRVADHHAAAGDPGRAKHVLDGVIARLERGPLRARALASMGLVNLWNNGMLEAGHYFERSLTELDDDVDELARVLVSLSFVLLNRGRFTDALDTVEQAVRAATAADTSALLSLALGMRAMIRFMSGGGADQEGMRRALMSQGTAAYVPVAFRAATQHALLLAWSEQSENAYAALATIRRGCIDRGEESDVIFVAFHECLVATWLGRLADADRTAGDAERRARQLGGAVPLTLALTARALTSTYAGSDHEARALVAEAVAAAGRSNMKVVSEWPATVLGFLELSLGRYGAAIATLTPLRAKVESLPDVTEIVAASFVPDLVEALVELDRSADAEPLVDILERNGSRLDRPWMLAVGGRGRAMLLAARGDVDGAARAAEQAIVHHNRVPMPFDRARTLMLLGRIRQQQRRPEAAAALWQEAGDVFDALGTPLWAARARADLDATGIPALSPAERRVARLTASGMTNVEVATKLFISPKTVEFHLARVYRKLGIRSRAELGRRLGEDGEHP